MQHLIDIEQLKPEEIEALIQRAMQLKSGVSSPLSLARTVAFLFYENSTRTRLSFELAAKRLGMTAVCLHLATSSEMKGETVEDTVQNLLAMGVDCFVVRHQQDGLPSELARLVGQHAHVVNAGDGQNAHPSQALLDCMTILEKKAAFEDLKIAIVGDLRHSRVANSLQVIFSRLKVRELALISPEIWRPEKIHFGAWTISLEEGLSGADVVMTLRVQRERLRASEQLDLDTYRDRFALTQKTLHYAKENAIVMHPGPVNRGVEIDSEVADGTQSVILQQVHNGVWMRMAILEYLNSEPAPSV